MPPDAHEPLGRVGHVNLRSQVGQNGAAQHQAERINDGVALAPLDLLGRIIADRIDRTPPLSAPFTLWLSTMAVVGLASLPASSRACS